MLKFYTPRIMINCGPIESIYIDSLRGNLARHFHEKFSLTVIYGGECFLLADDRLYPLHGGEAVLMPAYIPHACAALPGSAVSYNVFILPDETISGYPLPEDPCIIKNTYISSAEFFTTCGADELINNITTFISVACNGNTPSISTSHQGIPLSAMKRIADYIRAEWQRDISLDELSDISGLSKYHLIGKFRKAFGMTPHAYSINTRINKARELLKTGSSIADISLQLGFYDQSHFSNTFVKYTGITPQVYRKKTR